jgi:hypothetical protein
MSTLGDGTPLPAAMPNRLVIAGPYRWVRNPMAVAGIVQGAGVGLILESWLVLAYAVAGSLVWNYAIRPLEEYDLSERFGEQFLHYRNTVRCWTPQFPKTPAEHVSNTIVTVPRLAGTPQGCPWHGYEPPSVGPWVEEVADVWDQ